MPVRLGELPVDIRETTVAALRRQRPKLARDLAYRLSTEQGLDGINLADFAGILLTILGGAIEVRQRLVFTDDTTGQTTPVTLSAAALGTDLVTRELESGTVLAEAEAAVVRAQMNGGNRMERVGLLPTSVTIHGAASLLGVSVREIMRLVRSRELRASRRGRHLHIERDALDEYRRRG